MLGGQRQLNAKLAEELGGGALAHLIRGEPIAAISATAAIGTTGATAAEPVRPARRDPVRVCGMDARSPAERLGAAERDVGMHRLRHAADALKMASPRYSFSAAAAAGSKVANRAKRR